MRSFNRTMCLMSIIYLNVMEENSELISRAFKGCKLFVSDSFYLPLGLLVNMETG